MEQIQKIYSNDIGIAFQWMHVETNLVQLVFRDMGFHLSADEIALFITKVQDAKTQKKCRGCSFEKECKSILLQTPSNLVSIAVSNEELGKIEDLLKGTFFQIQLNDYLNDLCKN